MEILDGQSLGPYRIVAFLAQGAMGRVYRAHDPRLGRDVAIKVLPEDFAGDFERLRRFEQEARVLARLSEPNIVQIFDTGTWEDLPFLVMELVEGVSLRAWMDGRAVPPRRVLDVAVQIAQGLAAAHQAGIVHRDLKPENILVGRDGRVRLLDFGLAKPFRGGPGAPLGDAVSETATQDGRIVGTLGYMAPEQLTDGRVDGRTDLFALGVVLWEMITGRRPFQGESGIDTLHAILHQEPQLPEAGPVPPPALDRLLRRCLAKEPAQRFQTAQDLGFALEAVLGGVSSGSASRAVQSGGLPAGMKRRLVMGAGMALIGLLGLGLGSRRSSRAAPHYSAVTPVPGSIQSARFAPDGQSVVFSAALSRTGVQLDIYRFHLGDAFPAMTGRTGTVTALDGHGQLYYTGQSSFSGIGSSGSYPLYRWKGNEADSTAWINGAQDVDVAPNGTDVALTRYDEGTVMNCRLECPPGRVLFRHSNMLSCPRFNPDGDRIACIRRGGPNGWRGQIVVVDLKGKVLFESREFSTILTLGWDPSGREVLFTTRDHFPEALYIAGCDLQGRVRPVLRTHESMVLQDVSKDGRLLVVANRNVFEVAMEGPGGLSPLPMPVEPAGLIASPDGTLLALSVHEGDGETASYAYRPASRKLTRIDSGWTAFDISPDNQWILEGRDDGQAKDGEYQLRALPLGGGEPINYPTQGVKEAAFASFLPEGRQALVIGYFQDMTQRFILDPSRPPVRLEGGFQHAENWAALACGLLYRNDRQWFYRTWADPAERVLPHLGDHDVPVAWDEKTDEVLLERLPYDPSGSEPVKDSGASLTFPILRYGLHSGNLRLDRELRMSLGEHRFSVWPRMSGRPMFSMAMQGHHRLFIVEGALER